MKMYKFLAALSAVALTVGMTGCSDDDTTYDFPGVDGQVVIAPTVQQHYNIVKTPEAYVVPGINFGVEARTRIPATEEIKVKFEIDNSLIDAYNQEHSTSYVALPDGLASLVVPDEPVPDEPEVEPASRAGEGAILTIHTGASKSAVQLNMAIANDQALLAGLDLDTEYIVPVRMTEVTEGAARLGVSVSNISYVIFGLTEKMINSEGTPSGTLLGNDERANWTVEAGGGASEWYGWSNDVIIGSNMNYGQYPAGSYIDFNLGAPTKFDGIWCKPYNNSLSYTMFKSGAEIFTSNDGENWKSLGVLENTTAVVALYAPVTAQYVRVQFNSRTYVAIQGFNVYAK